MTQRWCNTVSPKRVGARHARLTAPRTARPRGGFLRRQLPQGQAGDHRQGGMVQRTWLMGGHGSATGPGVPHPCALPPSVHPDGQMKRLGGRPHPTGPRVRSLTGAGPYGRRRRVKAKPPPYQAQPPINCRLHPDRRRTSQRPPVEMSIIPHQGCGPPRSSRRCAAGGFHPARSRTHGSARAKAPFHPNG